MTKAPGRPIEASYAPGASSGLGTVVFWTRPAAAEADAPAPPDEAVLWAELGEPANPPYARAVTIELRSLSRGTRAVHGLGVEVGDAAEALAAGIVRRPASTRLADSVRVLSLAAVYVLDLIAREQFVPIAESSDDAGRVTMRWAPAYTGIDDRRRRLALAAALPDAARAAVTDAVSPASFVDRFCADALDALVRRAAPTPGVRSGWEAELADELGVVASRDWQMGEARAAELRTWLPAPEPEEIWTGRALLETPTPQVSSWRIAFEIESEQSGRRLAAAEVEADATDTQLDVLARTRQIVTALLGTDRSELTGAEAWQFVSAARKNRGEYAGIELVVPDEIETAGRGNLRLLVETTDPDRDAVGGATAADALDHLSRRQLRWDVYLGDEQLDPDEIEQLESADAPLVRLRDRWVAADALDLAVVRARLDGPRPDLSPGELVVAVLDGSIPLDTARGVDAHASVVASEDLVRLARAVRGPQLRTRPAPAGFHGRLRPYQARGVDWMIWLETEGLGGILADDMGLGKGVQAIALFLARLDASRGPTLVVCPTSVVGNWEHELRTFAPELDTIRHHGPGRASGAAALDAASSARTVVVTNYAILRRDADLLSRVAWHRIVLDEAQNIKNSASETARAARRLGAGVQHRLALTGTPVENDLTELWSILEFTNPGLLGSAEAFRTRFATPIERNADAERARRLRQVTAPFLLRRSKSDPDVIADLPDKHETTLYCNLTDEQATHYKQTVATELASISQRTGIGRRGAILALITKLKQICDHPELVGAHGDEADPIPRSGKLAHLAEMLEDVRASGDKSLVFTQYVRMGRIIADAFGAPFYHGGLTQKRRDAIVAEFQAASDTGPDVLVMSTKAGGLGLNLAAATRVFHYDRWWNPAVEDQATDRAHRIGQTRDVWVHKMVCLGTLEERIEAMLDAKRSLADSVVSSGERWLTELDDDELATLVRLEESMIV